jgi:C1A family cysteine protease
MIAPTGEDIDIQIDLRGSWAAVRDQGKRNSCLACATSDAHTYSHARTRPLSAEFLYYKAVQLMPGAKPENGLTFLAAAQALQDTGQPDERVWPYQKNQPVPWVPPPIKKSWHGTMISGAGVAEIVASLNARQPVVLGIKLTPGFLSPGPPYIIKAIGRGAGGHAVLVVGWAKSVQLGQLLLIRNSWGPGWGDLGCAWLATAYLTNNLIGCRTVHPLKTP